MDLAYKVGQSGAGGVMGQKLDWNVLNKGMRVEMEKGDLVTSLDKFGKRNGGVEW